MTQCPADGCDTMKEHHQALFGENGVRSQIVRIKLCMKDMVTRKDVWKVFFSCLFLVVLLSGFILDLWSTAKENSKALPEIKRIAENHENRIKENEVIIKAFSRNQSEQTKILRKIARDLGVNNEFEPEANGN